MLTILPEMRSVRKEHCHRSLGRHIASFCTLPQLKASFTLASCYSVAAHCRRDSEGSALYEVGKVDLETRGMKVVKEVLEISGELDTGSLRYNEPPNWGSLAHITLVSALEGEFDIMLEPDDILAMGNYDEAVKIVRKVSNAG